MCTWRVIRLLLGLSAVLIAADGAHAQRPGGSDSLLGDRPGAGQAQQTIPGGTQDTPLQGGAGPGRSRAPISVTRPQEPFGLPTPLNIAPRTEAQPLQLPPYGALSIPPGATDEGPPTGLTLDDAITRMLQENLELRTQFLEIPQSRADVLTAGLRANPVLYYDTQLIPYGQFSPARPGGQTQYDLNVTMPLDWNHKRQLRKEVATQALRVVEAQYQDAVRQQLDRLYQAYIDVLAARETVRFAHTSVEGLNRLLALAEALHAGGERTIADVDRIRIQRDAAEVGVAEAEASLQEALRSLAPLLNISPDTAEQLELRGSIRDQTPPPAGDLVPIALESRPDLAAYRLGLKYAQADARLARRERFQDVYAMYQPYTFQNNEPFGTKSAHSWGVGLTVPLPIFDRNQGRIQRADVNVSQTRIELAALEQQVATEVRQAERRYQISRASVERIENSLLPAAVKVRDEALRRYRAGQDDLSVFLNAQREYNELVRQYRDTMIRHRRSMLALNTAVGRRILP